MADKENGGDILKLPQSVIDKISAGEVIQRPYNAIKELIENSLDANSKTISIIVKDSGLRFIKIVDDGDGIRKEDFMLLCHRFATSKIKSFDDLCGVTSFGFRGEALASISNIARLNVLSKHKNSDLAYHARYVDGMMVDDDGQKLESPRVCAGNNGTQITVDDMFYRHPLRKSAFSNSREEYGKICSVVGRYAIQYANKVAFICKRDIDSPPDISTRTPDDQLSLIQSIYKFKVSQNLKYFKDFNKELAVEIQGVASLSSFTCKKYMFILFINNRLVDCNSLKCAISSVYSGVISRHQNPFFYISIRIDPIKIDANVHPSKQEVIFINQSKTVSYIQEFVKKLLGEGQDTLTLQTNDKQLTLIDSATTKFERRSDDNLQTSTPVKSDRIYSNKVVRTDHLDQSLDIFINNNSALSISINESKDDSLISATDNMCAISVSSHPRVFRLISVTELKESIYENKCPQLLNVIKKFTYIGPVSKSKMLLQFDVNIYLIDCFKMFFELFYQIIILNFGSFNYWKLDRARDCGG